MNPFWSVAAKWAWGLGMAVLIAIPILASASPLATPVPVSPLNRTIFEHVPRDMTVHWERVPNATGYRVDVQYHDDSGWKTLETKTITDPETSSFSFTFPDDQPGRWHVIALDKTGTYERSAPCAWQLFSFSTTPGMSTPSQVSPADNSHFQSLPRTVTLAWKPVAFAGHYEVEVEIDSGGWVAWHTFSVSSACVSFNFTEARAARWRVRALDGTGTYKASEPSAWRVFDFDH